MASATPVGNCFTSSWGYVQSSRPYHFMANVGVRIRDTAIAVYNFVFPKNEMTGRREIRIIPVWVENTLGMASYNSLCPRAKVSTDEELTKKVQTIFDKLIEKCPRKSMKWEVRVLQDDDTVNAFCLPGGKTVITTGMINKLKAKYDFDYKYNDTTLDDDIAAVMGHEIVHAAAGHGARKMQLSLLLFCVGKIVSFVLPLFLIKHKEAPKEQETIEQMQKRKVEERQVAESRQSLGKGLDTLFKFGSWLFTQNHGQNHELESDRYGIKLAYEAGYNVHASERLQEIFLEMKGKKDGDKTGKLEKGLQFISSHPASQKRLDANRQTIADIKAKGVEATYA